MSGPEAIRRVTMCQDAPEARGAAIVHSENFNDRLCAAKCHVEGLIDPACPLPLKIGIGELKPAGWRPGKSPSRLRQREIDQLR
jgi:hypothetical protein